MTIDFGYIETKDNLYSRIEANSKFGSFVLAKTGASPLV